MTIAALLGTEVGAANGAEESPDAAQQSGTCSQLACIRYLISNGDFDEAERRVRNLLRQAEKQCGATSTCVSEVLRALVETLMRSGRGSDDSTLELARRSLTIDRKIYGTNHERTATSLAQLATVLTAHGETEKANEYLDRALELNLRSPYPNTASLAVVHDNLGEVARVRGDFDRAEDHFRTALRLGEQVLAPDDEKLITILLNLANLYTEMGEFEQSRAVFDRAVEATESRLGEEDLGLAMQLNSLGHILMEQGDLYRATEYFERSLSIAEQVHGPEDPRLSCILGNLGIAYLVMGDPRADGYITRAVAIAEEKDLFQAAIWLENLALIEGAWDHGGAREKHERALEIFVQTVGRDSFRVAWVHDGLATLLAGIGEYEEAVAHLEEARRVYDASMGARSKFTMFAHFDLADTYASLGLHDDAKSILEDLLQTKREVYGIEHAEVGEALEELARVERLAGDIQGARAHCDQARAIREALSRGGNDVPSGSLALYASFEADAGNLRDARRLLEQAVDVKEATDGPYDPGLGVILAQLASVDLALGEIDDALEAAIRAEQVARNHFRHTIPSLSEREALRYSDVRVSGLDTVLTIGGTGGARSAGVFWDTLIRSRALVLDEMSLRNRTVVESDDPALRAMGARLQAASTQLANLTVRGLHSAELRALHARVQREKEELERGLSERSRSFRMAHAGDNAGFEEVAEALPADAALIAYARYRRADGVGGTVEGPGDGQSRASYLALVMTGSGRVPVAIPLGRAQDIETTLDELRHALADMSLDPGRSKARSEAAYRRISADLRAAVWDPIAPHLDGSRRVFVVPDGALNLVNLGALASGDAEYLIEATPPIHYLSSERDLILQDDPPRGKGLLAIGAPAFDDRAVFAAYRGDEESMTVDELAAFARRSVSRGARARCGDFASMQFDALPASDEELDQIVAAWRSVAGQRPTPRGPQAIDFDATVLRGSTATEAEVKRLASGRRVLHVATHGFFLGDNCASMLDVDRDGSTRQRGVQVFGGDNPLLMSGFALAGANHRSLAGPDEDDGILTAQEVAALDLTDVEWAVLSACDTGVGVVRAGEGIFGLRRAFQIAGARTLIMSLWPVDDQSSQRWMLRLYENRFTGGMATADAVHEASLGLLRDRRDSGESTHPFFWAGFIASGDWR